MSHALINKETGKIEFSARQIGFWKTLTLAFSKNLNDYIFFDKLEFCNDQYEECTIYANGDKFVFYVEYTVPAEDDMFNLKEITETKEFESLFDAIHYSLDTLGINDEDSNEFFEMK